MKKWMKNNGILACVVIAILFVLMRNNGFFVGRAGGDRDKEAASGQTGTSYAMDIPYEYKAEISEKNRINAAVEVSDTVREEGFKKAYAQVADVPEAFVFSILEDDYHLREGEEYENIRQYVGENEAYLYFVKNNRTFSFWCRAASYIEMAFQDQPAAMNYNEELYALDGELADFPLEECDRQIRELFQAYGVEAELRIRHRALDHETMEQEAVEWHIDGSSTKPDYAWSAADDSYHCVVWQLCNQTPVVYPHMLSFYGDILKNGNHTLLLNKERILQMYISDVYRIRYEEEKEPLLDFAEVVERYRQITEAAPRNSRVEITDIGLRVINVDEGGGRFRMAPIWIFYGTETSENGVEFPFAVMIDAVTGDEL